jgi:plastocyanin domain-containing protein
MSAQSVDPTSATIDPAAPLQIAYNSSKSVLNGVAKVQPLTSQAGLNRATTELSVSDTPPWTRIGRDSCTLC